MGWVELGWVGEGCLDGDEGGRGRGNQSDELANTVAGIDAASAAGYTTNSMIYPPTSTAMWCSGN